MKINFYQISLKGKNQDIHKFINMYICTYAFMCIYTRKIEYLFAKKNKVPAMRFQILQT